MCELLQFIWEQCGEPFQVQEWTRIFDLNLLRIHAQAPVFLTSLIPQGWVNRRVAGFSVLARGLSTKEGSLNDNVINVDHWITPICQYQIQQDPMYMQVDMLSALGIFYAAGFLGQHCPDSRSSLLKPLIRHHIWGLRACFKHARRFFTFKEVFWKSVKHFISQSVVCRPLHVLTQLWASSLQGKVLLFSSQLLVTTRVDPAGRQAMPARYGQR